MTTEQGPIGLYRNTKTVIEQLDSESMPTEGLRAALSDLASTPEVRTYFATIALGVPRLLPSSSEIEDAIQAGLVAPQEVLLQIQRDLFSRFPDMGLALEFLELYGEQHKPGVEIKFLEDRIEVEGEKVGLKSKKDYRGDKVPLPERVDRMKNVLRFFVENQGKVFDYKQAWVGIFGKETHFDPNTWRDIKLFTRRMRTKNGEPIFQEGRGLYGISNFTVRIVEEDRLSR